jgi:hypothetical protein
MRRLLIAFGLAVVMIAAAVLSLGQPVAAQAPTLSGTIYGPFYVDLWTVRPISSTAVTQTMTVLGSSQQYLGIYAPVGSTGGSLTVTVVRRWNGLGFFTSTQSVAISTTLTANALMTINTTTPYLPELWIQAQTSGATVTPTISLWGMR